MNQQQPGLPVFFQAAIQDGHLHVAPLGTPYDTASPVWVDVGPAPDWGTPLARAARLGLQGGDERTPWQEDRDQAGQTGVWPPSQGSYHRHFASGAVHRDGGAECDQPGTPRRVYVFDGDTLDEHERIVARYGAEHPDRFLPPWVYQPGERLLACQLYSPPSAAQRDRFKISDPEIVLGCNNRQGEGPLYFFVPVSDGAVRVAVCPQHAEQLARLYPAAPGG